MPGNRNKKDDSGEGEPALDGGGYDSEAATVLMGEGDDDPSGAATNTGTVLLSDDVVAGDPLPFEKVSDGEAGSTNQGQPSGAHQATPFEEPATVMLSDAVVASPVMPFSGEAKAPTPAGNAPSEHPAAGGTVSLADAARAESAGTFPFGSEPSWRVEPPNPLAPRAPSGPVMLSEALLEPEVERTGATGGEAWLDKPTELSAKLVPWPERSCLTLVITARCRIVPGEAATWLGTPNSTGDTPAADSPEASELSEPLRCVPFKARADVLVVGFAYAPEPGASAMTVTWQLGKGALGVKSEIAVFGERVWEPALAGMQPSTPKAFDRVPLRYEYAFGGEGDVRNPAGCGLPSSSGKADGLQLPQLERSDRRLRAPIQRPPPACWAPVPEAWRERWVEMAGNSPFPEFSEAREWARHQSALPAHQCAFLRGDEPFELVGMHPEHATLRGELPGKTVRAFVARSHSSGGKFEETAVQLDTVLFKPSLMEVTLTYRGQITVADLSDPQVASVHVRAEDSSAPPLSLEEWHAAIIKG